MSYEKLVEEDAFLVVMSIRSLQWYWHKKGNSRKGECRWLWLCGEREEIKCTCGLCRRCSGGGGSWWHWGRSGWQWQCNAKLKAIVKLELKGWAGRWAEHKKRDRLVRKNHPKSTSCHIGYVMRVGRHLKGREESLALQNDLHRRLDMAA